MANAEHLEILQSALRKWKYWHKVNAGARIGLSEVKLG